VIRVSRHANMTKELVNSVYQKQLMGTVRYVQPQATTQPSGKTKEGYGNPPRLYHYALYL